MGNYSRNTFDALKHYAGVRLQQGVPIVDADWNELEDVRRYELESFLRWFVGDGIPKGSDGFRISALAAQPQNDLAIAAGWCLVNGWQVENRDAQMTYKSQLSSAPEPPQPPSPGPIRRTRSNRLSQNIASGGSQPGAFPNLPGVPQPLNTPTQDRTDLVYLDVWEREVDSSEDPDLINEKIGVETCRRTKREWVVLVAEGMSNPENLTAAGGHACYPLALLHRKGGVAEISSSDIVDLRRAGVASISAPLTIKDNKVGIGMTSPEAKLTLRTPDQEETDTLRIEYFSAPQASHLTFNGYSYSNLPGLGSGISWVFNQRDDGTDYPVLTFFKGNVSIGRSLPTAKLEICADEFTDLTPALLLRGGTDNFPSLQFVDANSNTKYQICSSLGLLRIEPVGDSTGMSIDSLGNVGIGKTAPETKLHISGSDDVTISIDAPQNREAGIVFRTHGKDYVDWEFYRDESGDLRIWDGKIHINRVTVKPDGNVGIGTINPGEYKLCVSGDTKIEGNLTFGGDIITCTGGPETTLEGVNGTEHTVWFHYYDRNVLGIRHSSISGQQSWKVVIPAGVSFVQEK